MTSMFSTGEISPIDVARMFINTKGKNMSKTGQAITNFFLYAAGSARNYEDLQKHFKFSIDRYPSFEEAIRVWDPIRKHWWIHDENKWKFPALHLASQCLLETETWIPKHKCIRAKHYRKKIGGAKKIFSCSVDILSDDGNALASSINATFSFEEIRMADEMINNYIYYCLKCTKKN